MALQRSINLAITLGLIAALLIGCGSPAPQPQAPAQAGAQNGAASNAPAAGATPEKINVEVGPDEPQILLLEPEDESGVDSPFYLRVGVSNFKIPISDVKIYVAIDAACTPAGQTIPEDAQHVSLPQGTLENSRFELPLGPHRLCIQAANRDDIALQGPGMTRVIDVIVESVRQPSDD
jgi:hypothetical protein